MNSLRFWGHFRPVVRTGGEQRCKGVQPVGTPTHTHTLPHHPHFPALLSKIPAVLPPFCTPSLAVRCRLPMCWHFCSVFEYVSVASVYSSPVRSPHVLYCLFLRILILITMSSSARPVCSIEQARLQYRTTCDAVCLAAPFEVR